MNKSQFIDALSSKFEGNRKAAAEALDAVVDTITREVARGEKVVITGFGAFEQRVREARTVRNPQTGELIEAARKAVPKFTPGADLRNVISGAKQLPAATVGVAADAATGLVAKVTGKKAPARSTRSAGSSPGTASEPAASAAPAKEASAQKPAATKAPAKKSAGTTTKATTAKKSAAKKSPTSKASGTTAKKSPAKKSSGTTTKATTAKKAPAKKAPAKKSPAKKATGTTTKAPAKKAPAKKAPAKKTATGTSTDGGSAG